METKLYLYGNIIRVLSFDAEVSSHSVMVDVCLGNKQILSLFDGSKQFDADFIRSYLNILRESKVGFRLLSNSPEDETLRAQAIDILHMKASGHPIIHKFFPQDK